MKIDEVFNPLGLSAPPYLPAAFALHLRMVAAGFGLMRDACTVYRRPETVFPGPLAAAVKQGISAQEAWFSTLHDLTYGTIKRGLGLDQEEKPKETQVKLDI